MSDEERILCCLAVKLAQRRGVEDIAAQVKLPSDYVEQLLRLMESSWTRQWPDGTWGLTSSGDLKRNQLTA